MKHSTIYPSINCWINLECLTQNSFVVKLSLSIRLLKLKIVRTTIRSFELIYWSKWSIVPAPKAGLNPESFREVLLTKISFNTVPYWSFLLYCTAVKPRSTSMNKSRSHTDLPRSLTWIFLIDPLGTSIISFVTSDEAIALDKSHWYLPLTAVHIFSSILILTQRTSHECS